MRIFQHVPVSILAGLVFSGFAASADPSRDEEAADQIPPEEGGNAEVTSGQESDLTVAEQYYGSSYRPSYSSGYSGSRYGSSYSGSRYGSGSYYGSSYRPSYGSYSGSRYGSSYSRPSSYYGGGGGYRRPYYGAGGGGGIVGSLLSPIKAIKHKIKRKITKPFRIVERVKNSIMYG